MMRISSQSCVLENVQSQIDYYFGPEEVIIDQLCDTTNPSSGLCWFYDQISWHKFICLINCSNHESSSSYWQVRETTIINNNQASTILNQDNYFNQNSYLGMNR